MTHHAMYKVTLTHLDPFIQPVIIYLELQTHWQDSKTFPD